MKQDTPQSIPLPEGFRRQIREIGLPDAESLFAALDGVPAVSLRFNSRKPVSLLQWVECEKVDWCDAGIYLSERPSFTLMPEFHSGAFYVQEAASMIHREAIRRLVSGPADLLDLCAAPGGKTTAMADALADGSALVANEADPKRARILQENLIKWGYPHVAVTNARGQAFAAMRESFDVVAVDAPCSGEGMMRKETVARTQWSPGLVAQCAGLQREILAAAVEALKPGGLLLYSTCTFNRDENESQVEWLRDEFGLESIDPGFPQEWGLQAGIGTDMKCFRFMPHTNRSEGLFFAVLRKPGESRPAAAPAARNRNLPQCASWINSPEAYFWKEEKGKVSAIGPRLMRLVERLPEKARLLSAGIEVAAVKGKDHIPTEQLALCTEFRRDTFTETELSEADAVSYLRRETVTLPAGTPRGFVTVCHNGLPLGFMKNIGTRANNLFPAEWRIRI